MTLVDIQAINLIQGSLWRINYRSSRPEVFCKEGVLENFAKFTGKHLCQSLWPFFTLARVFSYEFCEIFKNTYFNRTNLVAASETIK